MVESERKAREVALYRQGKFRDVKLAKQGGPTKLEDMLSQMGEAKAATIQVVIKADVQGSGRGAARCAHQALDRRSAGQGDRERRRRHHRIRRVVGRRVERAHHRLQRARRRRRAKNTMKEMGVDVRYYSVIYEAIDDVKQRLSGLLAPEIKEQIVGIAQVREVFRSSKFGVVAGCLVTEGAVKRNNPIRVLRDNVVIFEGALESLRRFKDEAGEVRAGTECGIGVKGYSDVRVGDQIECFERIEVVRKL